MQQTTWSSLGHNAPALTCDQSLILSPEQIILINIATGEPSIEDRTNALIEQMNDFLLANYKGMPISKTFTVDNWLLGKKEVVVVLRQITNRMKQANWMTSFQVKWYAHRDRNSEYAAIDCTFENYKEFRKAQYNALLNKIRNNGNWLAIPCAFGCMFALIVSPWFLIISELSLVVWLSIKNRV